MKRFIKLLLILLMATATGDVLFGHTVRAVWMYDFDNWKNEPSFGNRIYSVSAMGYNQIFLGVLSHKLDEMGAGQYGAKMVEFITHANSLNIAVHAMTLQDPHFSLIYKHNDALARIQDILAYNLANPGAKFSGIHIDPEPHILLCGNDASHTCNAGNWESLPHVLWTTPPEETALAAVGGELENLSEPMKTNIKNRRAGIMSEFVTLLQRIRDEKIDTYNVVNDPDLYFSSTVGWWYNEKSIGGQNGYLPSGASDLTQYLDAIVPMVYSGGVGETVTDIVSRIDDEIREANAPTLIGISHESLQNFPGGVQATMNGLEAEFDNDNTFKGVTVFQFEDLTAAPTGCPETVVEDDLYQWVYDNIIKDAGPEAQKTMPRERNSEADDYDVPTAAQLVLWNDMMDKLLANNISEACALANQLGYLLIDFEESPTRKYYLLRTIPYDAETNPDPHFWGTYILNRNPLRRNLIIQAPHPFWDENTEEQGVEVFRLTGALFYMMAGTSRCNLTCDTPPGGSPGVNCSSCSGSTTACNSGVSYRYSIADMAHNEGSVFHETTKKLNNNLRYFIQLHGFGWDPGDPYAIISNGTSEAPPGYDPLPVLEDMLRHQMNDLPSDPSSICVVHKDWPLNSGSACFLLKGFDNTQGRFLNGGTSPCTSNAGVAATGRFIHIEQEKTKFRDERSDWEKVARAIANTFQVEFEVEPIEDTEGLLDPDGNDNYEPEQYSYNFIAPLRTEMLCKNSHLGTIPATNLSSTIASATYEDQTGVLTSSAVIGPNERVWYIAETSIVLTEGFLASSDNFFVAELKNEQSYCESESNYNPNISPYNRLFTSIYGPRMTSSSGNITRPYDFHRGEDMIDKQVTVNGSDPPIYCMCDGEVEAITSGGDEGTSVIVKCDATFYQNPGLGNIYIAYRHLNEFASGLAPSAKIRKGDKIGIMGGTGAATTNHHLHLSVQKKLGTGQLINLHPMRIFNNDFNNHLFHPINAELNGTEEKRVNMFLLEHSNGSANTDENYATFRIAVPYDKVAIRAIIVRHSGTYSQTADFEVISEERDNPPSCCSTNPPTCTPDPPCLDDANVGSLKLFPLPFLRAGNTTSNTTGGTAYRRYNSVKGDLCNAATGNKVCDHPAINFPVLNEGIFTTSAYVLDIKAKGLPQFFDPYDFQIDVLDIWGNGVRGTLTPPPAMLMSFPAGGKPLDQRLVSDNSIQKKEANPQNLNSITSGNQLIRIYPNPITSNSLTFELTDTSMSIENLTLTITNLMGQTIVHHKTSTPAEGKFDLDISDLAPGTYSITLNLDGQLVTRKLIRL